MFQALTHFHWRGEVSCLYVSSTDTLSLEGGLMPVCIKHWPH